MNIEDKFGSHVKSVFDNYEDGMADQGWAELLKKYPEKKVGPAPSRKVVPMRLWWAAAAAAIAIVCFTVFFVQQPPAGDVRVAGQGSSTSGQPLGPGTKNEETEHELPVAVESNELPSGSESNLPSPNTQRPSTRLSYRNVKDLRKAFVTESSLNANTIHESEMGQKQELPMPAETQHIPQTAAVKQPEEGVAAVAPLERESQKSQPDIEKFLERESRNNTAMASTNKTEVLTSFDIYAGTFLNYFEDNPAKVNAGFGVNANVKLTRKIYLSVGAGISENTVNYENSLPRSSVASLTSSFPLNQVDQLVGKPSSGGVVGPEEPFLEFASKTSGPSTDVKLNATLLNLDVPIAVKFYAGKNDRFYLLTGVNSNSYINQRYMQTYSTYNYASSMTETKEQEVEGSRLNGFDFANSAIFAVGISQDLGKTTTLTFEPFYRPSLKGLGDKNIRLNTLGVNLKLNVGRKK